MDMKIGTDIIQISRIEDAIAEHGEKFKERFLNPSEIDIAIKIETIAGFWAAKEAISKALGCGIGKDLSFVDILISKNKKGAPEFNLSSLAQKKYQISSSSLSISHDGDFAIAVVIIGH